MIICGIQGAGKSTLVGERFFETHVRISRDLLRTAHRESRFPDACLGRGALGSQRARRRYAMFEDPVR